MKETLQILRYSTPIRVILGSIVAVPIIIGVLIILSPVLDVLMILLTGQGLLTHVDYGIADPSLLGH